jgi:acyl carrier protein
MSREELPLEVRIEDIVFTAVAEAAGVEKASLHHDDALQDDLGLDSLDETDVHMEIEEDVDGIEEVSKQLTGHFHVPEDDPELDLVKARTIGDLIKRTTKAAQNVIEGRPA